MHLLVFYVMDHQSWVWLWAVKKTSFQYLTKLGQSTGYSYYSLFVSTENDANSSFSSVSSDSKYDFWLDFDRAILMNK